MDLDDDSQFGFGVAALPEFGIGYFRLDEAAELISVDMWFSGEIDAPMDHAEGLDSSDPRLLAALAETTARFTKRLCDAINSGKLVAKVAKRDFDECIIPSITYVEKGNLYAWLDERNYETGEIFEKWEAVQAEMTKALLMDAVTLRFVATEGIDALRRVNHLQDLIRDPEAADEGDSAMLLAAYKAALMENARLKVRLALAESMQPQTVDKPLHIRARRTLLTIIGALCRKVNIDPAARGSAQRIRELTEDFGFPVDDGTIAPFLAAIPDAIESRSR